MKCYDKKTKVLKVIRKIIEEKNENRICLLFMALHNNNDSLDHHIETQVIQIIFSICSFFIGGLLRVSSPLHVWSVHILSHSIVRMNLHCLLLCLWFSKSLLLIFTPSKLYKKDCTYLLYFLSIETTICVVSSCHWKISCIDVSPNCKFGYFVELQQNWNRVLLYELVLVFIQFFFNVLNFHFRFQATHR